MKLLFVGEGPHDVGPPDFAPDVRAATGVTRFWRDLSALQSQMKKR